MSPVNINISKLKIQKDLINLYLKQYQRDQTKKKGQNIGLLTDFLFHFQQSEKYKFLNVT